MFVLSALCQLLRSLLVPRLVLVTENLQNLDRRQISRVEEAGLSSDGAARGEDKDEK